MIKDAEALESGYKVNAIVLDKTGTITEGKPTVTELIWDAGIEAERERYEQIFLAMEQNSEHPLAAALVDELRKQAAKPALIEDFESLTGKGVSARYEGQQYWAGSHKLLNKQDISPELREQVKKLQAQAQTVIYFSNEAKVLAVAAIADKIKPASKAAVAALKKQGIAVYMLTGDNEQTAAAVAGEVGIDHFKAEVLPSDKADFIAQLQKEGKIVAMIGDGINDSQALALANLSIAMGRGSDIAIDVAKITLMSSDLAQVPKALLLSKKTVQTIRQNLFWAFIYNLIGIPIAAGLLYPFNGFLLNPMIAGAAMALSSVSVVSNSLRLKLARLGA